MGGSSDKCLLHTLLIQVNSESSSLPSDPKLLLDIFSSSSIALFANRSANRFSYLGICL
jgi:hypothetical protein